MHASSLLNSSLLELIKSPSVSAFMGGYKKLVYIETN
jgi:hypothetical protein